MTKIAYQPVTGTQQWVTTDNTQYIGMIEGVVNSYSVQRIVADKKLYPVQGILVMWEPEETEMAHTILSQITDGLIIVDYWTTADWLYRVYLHRNAYNNLDAIDTLKYNLDRMGFVESSKQFTLAL